MCPHIHDQKIWDVQNFHRRDTFSLIYLSWLKLRIVPAICASLAQGAKHIMWYSRPITFKRYCYHFHKILSVSASDLSKYVTWHSVLIVSLVKHQKRWWPYMPGHPVQSRTTSRGSNSISERDCSLAQGELTETLKKTCSAAISWWWSRCIWQLRQ